MCIVEKLKSTEIFLSNDLECITFYCAIVQRGALIALFAAMNFKSVNHETLVYLE